MSLGELATTMREAAGSRSVHFTQYVGSGTKLTPAAISQVDRFSGRIEQLWLLIDQALAQMEATPQLKAALETVKTGFRDEEARTYGAMYEAARDGKPAGMSLTDWRAWTQKSLATILQMRDAAFEQAKAEIDADLSLAGWRLALSLLAILVVTGTVVGIVLMFHRGVVRPLGQLANSVGLMLSGADDARIPAKVGMVEIDAISHALGDFQANIQRVRALEEQEREAAAAARLARGAVDGGGRLGRRRGRGGGGGGGFLGAAADRRRPTSRCRSSSPASTRSMPWSIGATSEFARALSGGRRRRPDRAGRRPPIAATSPISRARSTRRSTASPRPCARSR